MNAFIAITGIAITLIFSAWVIMQPFAKHPFAKITMNGNYCIVDINEIHSVVSGNDDFEIQVIWLTKNQFESMTEFQGW